MFVLAGGRSTTLDKVRTILAGLAEGLFVVSEDPAAANLMNLAGNVLIATTLQGMVCSFSEFGTNG